jgi:hypothetical protein
MNVDANGGGGKDKWSSVDRLIASGSFKVGPTCATWLSLKICETNWVGSDEEGVILLRQRRTKRNAN